MSETASYYKLDVGNLPDSLFHLDVPVDKWLACTSSAGKEGFPSNSLNVLHNIPWDVEVERLVGIALYMVGNIIPFTVPLLFFLSWFSWYAKACLWWLVVYVAALWLFEHFYFLPRFLNKYKKPGAATLKDIVTGNIRENHYVYTERNITKYLSMNFVWPRKMHRPEQCQSRLIFCIIPHGVAPFGVTAYPLWSKLWSDRLCHWTAAPSVLKIPIVGYYLKMMGYIPAKTSAIHDTLTKKEENVGIILDGIAGMFQTHWNEETAYVKSRKGIVKIALRAGATIVPVYAFGHTALWTVVVDPFGILERVSNAMGVALTPFFGRFGWFLGPPRRVPVTVCLGEPIVFTQVDDPSNELINENHQRMLDGFLEVFEKHKRAYGWEDRNLVFV